MTMSIRSDGLREHALNEQKKKKNKVKYLFF
jgi:hypothetical protein